MRPWVEAWAPEQLCSGVRGRGAEDGWYATAVVAEAASAGGANFSASTFDLWKAYDRLQRPLLFLVMAAAGWPRASLLASALAGPELWRCPRDALFR
eukprot:8050373-Alexandrium_andersonii.AAC.1